MEEQPDQTPEIAETLTSHGMTPVEEAELADYWAKMYEDAPEETKSSPEAGIADLEQAMNLFEKNFSLDQLHEITVISPVLIDKLMTKSFTRRNEGECDKDWSDREQAERKLKIEPILAEISEEDARQYRLITAAAEALKPITLAWNALRENTTIEPARLAELKTKYKILSQAVGILNSGRIDHDR